MSRIQITDLTFAYAGDEPILQQINLTLDTDWRLGLVGRNGRGKTTLLRLLTGALKGTGSIAAHVDFTLFPYPWQGDTALELLHYYAPTAEEWQMLREMSLLGVSAEKLYQSEETLSGGERVKLALCVLFLRDNAFLLIDEPTNHLDAEGRMAVAAYLKSKRGYILVSHDRAFLNACVDHVLGILRRSIVLIKGDFDTFEAEQNRRETEQLHSNEKLQKQVVLLQAAARRSAQWSDKAERAKFNAKPGDCAAVDRGFLGAKAAKIMKQAKVVERRAADAAAEKKGLLQDIERIDALRLSPLISPKEIFISARDFSVVYNDNIVFEPVTFVLRQGDRLRIEGQNGCGKTSILEAIQGVRMNVAGTLMKINGLNVSYVPQNTDSVGGSIESFFSDKNGDVALFRSILAKLEVRASALEKDLSDCSQGQKKKLLLARSFSTAAHLYIWDEPLNYVDIVSREQICEALLVSKATLVFVEHDRAFAKAVQTAELRLHKRKD